MLEPCAVKVASTVLRGGRWQQCHPLTRWEQPERSPDASLSDLIEGAPAPQKKVMSCPKAINP